MGYGGGVLPSKMSEDVLTNPESADCLIPMGITSENVAKQYKISRDVQDTFAANSFAKASAAQKAGKFKEEIVPVKVSLSIAAHRNQLMIRSNGQTPRPKKKRRSLLIPMMESGRVSPRSHCPNSNPPFRRMGRRTLEMPLRCLTVRPV